MATDSPVGEVAPSRRATHPDIDALTLAATKDPFVLRRYWQKVEKSDGCWLWTGARAQGAKPGTDGRAQMRGAPGQPLINVGRFSYALHHGSLSRGMFVVQTCLEPRCVRPDHLQLVDRAEIFAHRDRATWAKRKLPGNPPTRGISWNSKLSEEKVTEIIKLLIAGVDRAEIAASFDVDVSAIYQIANGQSWTHVPRPEGVDFPTASLVAASVRRRHQRECDEIYTRLAALPTEFLRAVITHAQELEAERANTTQQSTV